MACSACANKAASRGKGGCDGKNQRLRSLRVQLVTLFNTTSSNNAKRVEYREMIVDIDNLIQNSATVCPSHDDIVFITNYINNERNINYR
jgi:hypothetical protein